MQHHHNDDPQWRGYALTPYALASLAGYRGSREEYVSMMNLRDAEMKSAVHMEAPQALTAEEKRSAMKNIGYGTVTGHRIEL